MIELAGFCVVFLMGYVLADTLAQRSYQMDAIVRALVSVTKVDPKKALKLVLAAIGVLTVATEALKEVAKALSGF